MKKWLVLAIVAILLLLGVAAFVFTLMQTDDEKVFRDYLKKAASTEHLETDEKYSGTGVSLNGKAYLDTVEKKVSLIAEMECSAKVQEADVKLKSTLQTENEIGFVRINEITGEFPLTEGSTLQLSDMYVQTIGIWYKIPEDQASKSQLDSGVYVFNSAIVAPNYNTNTIVNALIDKKAFVLESVTEEGDNKTIVFKANRQAYLDVLNEVFPDLKNKEEILDGIFADGDSRTNTVTVNNSSDVVSEKLTDENICAEPLAGILGEEPEGMAQEISGTSTILPKGSVQITPITNSKPIDELENDIILPETILTPEI